MDIIPVVSRGGFGTNAEDGVVLADAALRKAVALASCDLWRRIEARRHFMTERIGIGVDDSVLPMIDIQGWLPPLLLSPAISMTRHR